MQPVSVAAIYLLFWVLTLFAVLPFGVSTSDEAGEKSVDGQADSAPVNPKLGRKLIWTTIISAVLFGVFWLNYAYEWVRVEDVPGWR
jgi:predicted secreted protein